MNLRKPLLLFALIGAGSSMEAQTKANLYFIENKGQIQDQHQNIRTDIGYRLSTSPDLNIFIGSNKIHYQWNECTNPSTPQPFGTVTNSYRMDVELLHANPKSKVRTEEKLTYYEQYYTTTAPGVKAHTFQKITYENVYPNIDWTLYVNNSGQLEYDFKVHPGGKVSDIQLRYMGTESLKINEQGGITATTPKGTVTEQAPVSFLENGTPVPSKFVLKENVLSFTVAAHEGTLIIDPVLEWSTYYGGSGSDLGRFIACDQKGFVYMTGSAASASNIATTGAHQVTYGNGGDAFLVKFDSSGARIWATYYGGTRDEQGWSVAVDEFNSVYIAGQTTSDNNIAIRGHQNTFGGGAADAYLAKFTEDGVLSWATYYGGTGNDEGWGVASNKKGFIYLTGRTASISNIAKTGAHQLTNNGGTDAFLVKFDTAGNRQWATYLGGEGNEYTWAIACDDFDNVYVSGETGSKDGMATAGAHQTIMTPSNGSEAFITRFNGSGKRIWGTYYGGNQSGQVFGTGIACDPFGNLVATGYTVSTVDIATPGSHQPASGGNYESYLVKFDSLGKRLWGTYYGGIGLENGYGVDCDHKGNIYITGYTTSKENIATSEAFQSAPSSNASNDFYVAKFNPEGQIQWGSYYGAGGYDAGFSIAHDQYRNVYVGGFVNANGLGTTNAFQQTLGGGFDGLLMRISECTIGELQQIIGPDSVCPTTTQTYSIPAVPGALGYFWKLPDGWVGSSTSDSITVTATMQGGVIQVWAYNDCDTAAMVSVEVFISVMEQPVITVNEFELGTQIPYASYQWLLNDAAIPGATSGTLTVKENGNYKIIVTNESGCTDTSDVYLVSNYSSIHPLPGWQHSLVIYPNPAKDKINIESALPVHVVLTTIEGKIIQRTASGRQLHLNDLSDGLYFLNIYDVSQRLIQVEKVVVRH